MTMLLMGWLRALVRGRSLTPAWEYAVKGVIWRVLPTETGQFVGEERNIQEKSVSFFCIRQDSGAIQWADVRLPERWWIGIEAVHNSLVLLHEFALPDFPDHKKIHALDLSSGRLRWSNEKLRYIFARGDRIYAADDLGAVYSELDSITGEETQQLNAEEVHALRRTAQYDDPIDFPLPFVNSEGRQDDVARTIEKLVSGANRIQFIEYLQKGDILAVDYYSTIGKDPLERLMDQHFIIAERQSGRILYREVLNSNASGAVPDAFFGLGDRLFAITDKRVLKAFNLPPGSTNRG